MSSTELQEVVVVEPNGLVRLPQWAWERLYRMSGIRSKRKRHIKKAVKKQFTKIVREYLDSK